jgi:hypothetical protein
VRTRAASPEVQRFRGLMGAVFALVCFLLGVGAVNDLEVGNWGFLLLIGAVVTGGLTGAAWAIRGPRDPAMRWEHARFRTRMGISLAFVVPTLSLFSLAQRMWDPLAVMLCACLAGVAGGSAAAVCALARRAFASE